MSLKIWDRGRLSV